MTIRHPEHAANRMKYVSDAISSICNGKTRDQIERVVQEQLTGIMLGGGNEDAKTESAKLYIRTKVRGFRISRDGYQAIEPCRPSDDTMFAIIVGIQSLLLGADQGLLSGSRRDGRRVAPQVTLSPTELANEEYLQAQRKVIVASSINENNGICRELAKSWLLHNPEPTFNPEPGTYIMTKYYGPGVLLGPSMGRWEDGHAQVLYADNDGHLQVHTSLPKSNIYPWPEGRELEPWQIALDKGRK